VETAAPVNWLNGI